MVLHKKQKVLPQGLTDEEINRLSLNTELWALEITAGQEEYFVSYESYLRIKFFYDKKEFTCRITGRSGLTFYEAKASEERGEQAVEMNFPDRLREPVLRRVQHDTTPRFDALVQKVYDEFKTNFFPGEDVFLLASDNKLPGVVKDKVQYAPPNPSRYHLHVPALSEAYTLVDNPSFISRSRESFNKELLRGFLRSTVARESWHGAPWTVRAEYCLQYNINQTLAHHLQREAIGAKRKADKMLTANGQDLYSFFHPERETHHIKNGTKIRMPRMSSEQMAAQKQSQAGFAQGYANGDLDSLVQPQPALPYVNTMPMYTTMLPQSSMHQMPFIVNGKTAIPPLPAVNGRRKSGDPTITGTTLPIGSGRPAIHKPPPMVPVPVVEKIKYPIEDLDIKPRPNVQPRPPLKFISDAYPDISEDRVGDMLFVWSTMNMQKELFLISNFTLDDMIEALSLTSTDVFCELLVELYCSSLKILVDTDGDITIEQSWGFEPDEDSSPSSRRSTKSPSAPPELPPPAKSTRSSFAKAGTVLKEPSPSPAPVTHRAEELFAEYDWLERLKERDFTEGGWQMVLTGFIFKVLSNDSPQNHFKPQCVAILAHLVPHDREPTVDTVIEQFASMEFNLRMSALNIAVYFVSQTGEFRDLIMQYPADIELLRQEKVILNRQKQQLATELRELASQYAIERPNHLEESPAPEPIHSTDVSMTGNDENDDEDDEDMSRSRKTLRNAKLRDETRKRKLEQESARKEAKKKKKQAKKKTDWEILCEKKQKTEEELKTVESQVEEKLKAMVQSDGIRVNQLGKDRWCNTYWWYEGTRILADGSPDSDAGYSQGRLWVQGPPEEFFETIKNPPEKFAKEDKERYGMSALERKEKDEGSTSLNSSSQWGYYDDPGLIPKILSRLDDRGSREKTLISNLELERITISRAMERMKAFRAELEEAYQEALEEEPRSRVTRKKTVVDPDAHKHCLEWRNNSAREILEHSHFEQPRPKKRRVSKPTAKRAKAPARAPTLPQVLKNTKRVTRQGARYG